MANLISGKEALIAIGKGERVQYSFDDDKFWQNDIANLKIADFGSGHYEFRLKPRTIKLNVEIPEPFEPKVGDIYYFINSSNLKGYGFNKFSNDGDDECLTFYGAWRTEDEIKQVVAALRQVFGLSDDAARGGK